MPPFVEGSLASWNFSTGAFLHLKVSFIDNRFIYLSHRYDYWKDGVKIDRGVTHRYDLSSKTLREFTSDSWELLPHGTLTSADTYPYEEGC